MRLCLIICATLLTGCAERIRTVYVVQTIPADLRQPVNVKCPPGNTMARAGVCLVRLNAGLSMANEKIRAIDEILMGAEALPD